MKKLLTAITITTLSLVSFSISPARAEILGRLEQGQTRYFRARLEPGQYKQYGITIEGRGEPSLSIYTFEEEVYIGTTQENITFSINQPVVLHLWTSCNEPLCYFQVVFWNYNDAENYEIVDVFFQELPRRPFEASEFPSSY